MSWCFAIVNARLSEIYFDMKGRKPYIKGHCYIKLSEFKTKHEQRMIKTDTAKYRFSWRKGIYTDLNIGRSF